MTISSAEIIILVKSYVWPFMRVGAFLSVAPIFGARTVPARIRLFFALMLAFLLVPGLPPVPVVDPFSAEGLLISAQQVLIGSIMGLILMMIFNVFMMAGEQIAMSMGLGFASTVDPQHGSQSPVLSQLFFLIVTLFFLSMNGHLLILNLLGESFQWLPVSLEMMSGKIFLDVAQWGTRMFSNSVLIALPALLSIGLVNLAFGIIAKAAPQLSIFAVGFPITMLVGFFVLLFALPFMIPQFTYILEEGGELIKQVLVGR